MQAANKILDPPFRQMKCNEIQRGGHCEHWGVARPIQPVHKRDNGPGYSGGVICEWLDSVHSLAARGSVLAGDDSQHVVCARPGLGVSSQAALKQVSDLRRSLAGRSACAGHTTVKPQNGLMKIAVASLLASAAESHTYTYFSCIYYRYDIDMI